MAWQILALMALGYVVLGIFVSKLTSSVVTAYVAGVAAVVMCTYITIKFRK